MTQFVDLHLHSTCSDGADAPAEVVAHAARNGLAAIALTDHDTTEGLAEAAEAAREMGIEFLNGVEVSTLYGHHSIHILGYGIEPGCPELEAILHKLRDGRERRTEKIVEKLQERGLPITMDEILALTDGDAPGRLHIARVLHDNGACKTVQEAFDKWLKFGKSCFVPIPKVSCERAVEAIHAANGLAFIAHPGLGNATRKLLPHLLASPFDGIEVIHSKHSQADTVEFKVLAQEQGLMISGGSDCHGGANGPRLMGGMKIPYAIYEAITEALAAKRS